MLIPPLADRQGQARCDAIQSLAFAACDDELAPDDIVAINAHLADCGPCRHRVESDARFLQAIRRAVALDAAPQSLRDRVAQSLQSHAPENAST